MSLALVLLGAQPAGGQHGSRTAWLLIGGVAVLILVAIVASRTLRDTKQQTLDQAPGRELDFPDGKLIDEAPVGSIMNLGASFTRLYGTNASAEQVAAFYDGALERIGYRQVEPHWPASEPSGQDDELLRQYERGPYTYRIWLRSPPQRFRGVSVTGPYRHLLYARISNERR